MKFAKLKKIMGIIIGWECIIISVLAGLYVGVWFILFVLQVLHS